MRQSKVRPARNRSLGNLFFPILSFGKLFKRALTWGRQERVEREGKGFFRDENVEELHEFHGRMPFSFK